MPNFRYVAIAPARIDDRKTIGPASYLHDFLVDHQTDPEGNVRYGKAISYAWIRSRWPEAPPARTLRRHMARLKSAGCVVVTKLPFHQGMLVRLVGSAKWPQQIAQLPLFPSPEPLLISSGKPVSKLSNSSKTEGPKVAPQRGQKWPVKAGKNLREEKSRSQPLAVARSSPLESATALEERRRLLQSQAQFIQAKYKTSR